MPAPYSYVDSGEEYLRILTEERTARVHAERLADSHAKNSRVLEVSKTELVRKMLSMKIRMEKEEREKARKLQSEPSSLEVISDMKKQIEVTRGELTDSTHDLAEESRRSAIAAQELVNMNRTMRTLEEELRETKQKLSETERSKHEVMIRSTNFDKRVRAREALSENRLVSAEVQSANAQSLLEKLEERIAYLDRRDALGGGPQPTPGVAPAAAGTEDNENKVPPLAHPEPRLGSAEKFYRSSRPSTSAPAPSAAKKPPPFVDPDRRAVYTQQVLKNVDLVQDLAKPGAPGGQSQASFSVPNMVENDGDLHISEARTVLVDPRKLDPTVGAHMDYLTFKAFSAQDGRSRGAKSNASDLDRASYIHQRQFAARKDQALSIKSGKASPAIDQTVKNTHAAYAQFSKYKKHQDTDNVSVAEKKLSALVNENHQLKVGKEKSDIQHKAAVEELEDLKEKLRVTRMENEHYRSISNNQEQDLIGWKVSTFEKIALLDTNVRKTLEDAQSGIEQKAKASIDAKLDQTEQRMKTLFSCVEALQARYKRESKNLQDKKSQAAALEETVESQKKEIREAEEKHEQHKLHVAETVASAKKLKAEAAEEKAAMSQKIRRTFADLQLSTSQSLEGFQHMLNEMSIKAARVFVEADRKTSDLDKVISESGYEESLRSIADGLDNQLKLSDEITERVLDQAKSSMEYGLGLVSKLEEVEKAKTAVSLELEKEKKDRVEVEAIAAEASRELEAAKEVHAKLTEETKKELDEKEEKLQNTISEASLLLQEVDELTERIVEKEKEVAVVQAEASQLTKTKEEAEKSLETCKAALGEAQAKTTSMEETVDTLKKTVEKKEEDLAAAREEVKSEVAKVAKDLEEEKDKEVEDMAEKIKTMKAELIVETMKLTEAEASCEEAGALIIQLKQTHEREKKEILESVEEETKTLQDKITKSDAQIKTLEDQIEMEQTELESYGDTIAEAEKLAEEAQAKSKDYEEKIAKAQAQAEGAIMEVETLREQLSNAVSQKQAAEERTATAISKLYDMESRVEYEKKRAEGVVQVVSQQLNMEGRGQTAALITDFARLRQQLETEVDQTKRAELEERLDSLKLAMQYDEADTTKGNASFMQLENKLQTERDIRKRLEGELKTALDKCLANEEENQMLLKEYEEVVEENKFLVSQIENLSK